jgi:hypothetical protein
VLHGQLHLQFGDFANTCKKGVKMKVKKMKMNYFDNMILDNIKEYVLAKIDDTDNDVSDMCGECKLEQFCSAHDLFCINFIERSLMVRDIRDNEDCEGVKEDGFKKKKC